MVNAVRRPSKRSPAVMKHADHLRLWRLVEGAVVDAFLSHPSYLTDHGAQSAVASVTKRVVGQLVGNAKGTRKGGRDSDCSPAAPAKSCRASARFPEQAEDARVLSARPHCCSEGSGNQ